MAIHRTLEVVAVCALALSACHTGHRGHRGSAALTDADRKEMQAIVSNFDQAVLAGDWPKVVSFYSEDGILLPPNGPAVQGRVAMQKLFESWPRITAFKESVSELEGRGDLAYGRGTYQLAMVAPGGKPPVKEVGKTLAIWQRQADGSWRVSRVAWNSDAPAAR